MMLTAFARRARSLTSSAAAKAACLCGIVMVQPTQFSVALRTSKKLPTRSGRTSIGTTTASMPRSSNQRFMRTGGLHLLDRMPDQRDDEQSCPLLRDSVGIRHKANRPPPVAAVNRSVLRLSG